MVDADGWEVSGLNDYSLTTGALEFVRQKTSEGAEEETLQGDRFPVFVRVHRRVRLDLDWTVETEVVRWAPANGGLSVQIPLLAGESVLTGGVEVQDGQALVAMAADQHRFRWQSALSRAPELGFTAGTDEAWTEVWSVAASPMWHLD